MGKFEEDPEDVRGFVVGEMVDLESGKPLVRFTGSYRDVADCVAIFMGHIRNPLMQDLGDG